MTASTPIYGFPVEVPGDRPGVSLSGGPTGDESDILAESVEAELERIDASLSSVVSQVEAIIPAGLTTIDQGTETANFTITVPSGEFRAVRLLAVGELDGTGRVFARVNADTTSDLHIRHWMLRTANTGALSDSASGSPGTRYYVGRWAVGGDAQGGLMDAWFLDAHEPSRVPFYSVSHRMSSGSGGQKLDAWGCLESPRTLESLQIQAVDAAFTSCRWTLQGVPA